MLILDNGAHSIKASDGSRIHVIPNCVARAKDDRRIYVATQLDEKKSLATLQYRRAHEKGYLVNWEVEKVIWDNMFEQIFNNMTPSDLILTEPPHNLSTLQGNCDEMVFEEYKVQSYIRCTTAHLIPWGTLLTFRDTDHTATSSGGCLEVVLVIDSGYSFTHITPVIRGIPDLAHTKRSPIGGKFLTNAFKEMISFRQYDMMEETQLINLVKEQCCFVSCDFEGDMERARAGTLSCRYVLPDLSSGTLGYVATPGTVETNEMQLLNLKYELFAIPELLFRPSDIGSKQAGIVEGVMDALKGLPDEIIELCLDHIVLIGGNTKFPGFQERFERDLRALAPTEYRIRTYKPDDPISYACECGLNMAQDKQHIEALRVTREEYLKTNKRATLKFNNPSIDVTRPKHETLGEPTAKRRESKYEELSDRSDTPRSFSPDTEPEDQVMQDE